eukprot:2809327-Pleurochrysis_carterae.AAC.6
MLSWHVTLWCDAESCGAPRPEVMPRQSGPSQYASKLLQHGDVSYYAVTRRGNCATACQQAYLRLEAREPVRDPSLDAHLDHEGVWHFDPLNLPKLALGDRDHLARLPALPAETLLMHAQRAYALFAVRILAAQDDAAELRASARAHESSIRAGHVVQYSRLADVHPNELHLTTHRPFLVAQRTCGMHMRA